MLDVARDPQLADHLRGAGRTVVVTREPGGSPAAEQVRANVVRWSEVISRAGIKAAD